MQHSVREEHGVVVASFAGEVDLAHSPKARQVLLGAVHQGKKVLVDLGAVTYIDSSGIASLVEAFQLSRRNGTGFALVSVGAAARRVLTLSRLDKVFPMYDTVADAL